MALTFMSIFYQLLAVANHGSVVLLSRRYCSSSTNVVIVVATTATFHVDPDIGRWNQRRYGLQELIVVDCAGTATYVASTF